MLGCQDSGIGLLQVLHTVLGCQVSGIGLLQVLHTVLGCQDSGIGLLQVLHTVLGCQDSGIGLLQVLHTVFGCQDSGIGLLQVLHTVLGCQDSGIGLLQVFTRSSILFLFFTLDLTFLFLMYPVYKHEVKYTHRFSLDQYCIPAFLWLLLRVSRGRVLVLCVAGPVGLLQRQSVTLQITNLMHSDTGLYQCRAEINVLNQRLYRETFTNLQVLGRYTDLLSCIYQP